MAHSYMTTVADKSARAMAKDVSISTKVAIEVCNFLRGKKLDRAISILENVRTKTEAIPYKRFTDGVGHKPGKIGAGRFPVKAATELLVLLESVKSNAANQGMTGTLVIKHIAANRASRPMRNRAKYRGEFKRTHVEVVVVEAQEKKSESKKAVKKTPAKADEKKPESTEKPKAESKVEKKEEKPAKEAPKEEKKSEPKAEEVKPAKEEKPEAKESKSTDEEKVEEKKNGN